MFYTQILFVYVFQKTPEYKYLHIKNELETNNF